MKKSHILITAITLFVLLALWMMVSQSNNEKNINNWNTELEVDTWNWVIANDGRKFESIVLDTNDKDIIITTYNIQKWSNAFKVSWYYKPRHPMGLIYNWKILKTFLTKSNWKFVTYEHAKWEFQLQDMLTKKILWGIDEDWKILDLK